jgi:hypothetical protein
MVKTVGCPKCEKEDVVVHDLGSHRTSYDCKNLGCLHSWILGADGRQEPTGQSAGEMTLEQIEEQIAGKACEAVENGETSTYKKKEAIAVKKLAKAKAAGECGICGKKFAAGQWYADKHEAKCKGNVYLPGKKTTGPKLPPDEQLKLPDDPVGAAVTMLKGERDKIIQAFIRDNPELARIDNAIKLLENGNPT